MNKFIIAGVIAFLLIGGGAYYFFQNSGTSSPLQNNSHTDSSENGSFETITGNIKDLFAQNAALECTFSYDAESGSSEGTVYIANHKMRGDFSYNGGDGQSMKGSMIRDNEYIYTWNDAQEQGFKMQIDKTKGDAMKEDPDHSDSETFDFDHQDADYRCRPWMVNSSMFTPPADVEFIDFAAQTEGLQKNLKKTMGDDHCASCDQLPEGDVRNQCLSALGCK